MPESPCLESGKVTKRKGTRSVSTLTPQQLARKRANDREAQRAIRARTKEHIESLERKVEELKSKERRDKVIQDLLRKNHELQTRINELEANLSAPRPSFPAPGMLAMRDQSLGLRGTTGMAYDMDGLPASAMSSRASSFGQGPSDYSTPGFGGASSSYLPTPEPCEPWQQATTVPGVAMSSVVSSPSSTGHPDEFVPGYIPTSAPSNLMGGTAVPPSTLSCVDESGKAEFEGGVNPADQRYPHPSVPQANTGYLPQTWPALYPSPASYYSDPQSLN